MAIVVSMVGSKFRLLKDCMGMKAGSVGYCYNDYPDFDDPEKRGVELIFENGSNCGFSVDEQNWLVEYDGYNMLYTGYEYVNVGRLSKDYRDGYWKW